jgi:hypothetical protein
MTYVQLPGQNTEAPKDWRNPALYECFVQIKRRMRAAKSAQLGGKAATQAGRKVPFTSIGSARELARELAAQAQRKAALTPEQRKAALQLRRTAAARARLKAPQPQPPSTNAAYVHPQSPPLPSPNPGHVHPPPQPPVAAHVHPQSLPPNPADIQTAGKERADAHHVVQSQASQTRQPTKAAHVPPQSQKEIQRKALAHPRHNNGLRDPANQ